MNFKFLTIISLSLITLTSCSSDDENTKSTETTVFGKYELVSYNTIPATDINDDGIESQNQALESNCHNEFSITLNEDGTSNVVYTFLELETDSNDMVTQNIECDVTNERSGTFAVENNILTLQYDFDGTPEQTVFTIEGNTITSENEEIDLLTRNDEGRLVFVDGNLRVVLEKQ